MIKSISDKSVTKTKAGVMNIQNNVKAKARSRLGGCHQQLVTLLAGNPSVSIQSLVDSLSISRHNVLQGLLRLQADGWFRRIGPIKALGWTAA